MECVDQVVASSPVSMPECDASKKSDDKIDATRVMRGFVSMWENIETRCKDNSQR